MTEAHRGIAKGQEEQRSAVAHPDLWLKLDTINTGGRYYPQERSQ